jgi:hypothetical protein
MKLFQLIVVDNSSLNTNFLASFVLYPVHNFSKSFGYPPRSCPQFTDRESVENEEIYRQQRTLRGHQSRITTLINQLSTCITKGRGPDEIVDILESIEKAWQGYNNAYGKYLSKNLAEEEFARIEGSLFI